jgi:hypothetical protein
MRKPIALRADSNAASLRWIARESEDADQVRRLLALAVIYDGGSRNRELAADRGRATPPRRHRSERRLNPDASSDTPID